MLLKLGCFFVMQAWTAVAASCCGSALRKEIIDSGQACVLLRLGSFHIESEQSYPTGKNWFVFISIRKGNH